MDTDDRIQGGGMIRVRRVLEAPSLQAAICALIPFGFYVKTLAPTVMWYDMGEFATAAYTLGIAHNTGYPLFMLLGKLFTFLPFADPAFRVNLMSATMAALAVGLTYVFVYRLTRSKIAAALSGFLFGFSSTLWGNATWAEVYTLNATLSIGILLLIDLWRRRDEPSYLYAAAGLFGLGLGNHRLLVGAGLSLAYFVWAYLHDLDRSSWSEVGKLGLFFLLGFSVQLYLPIRAAANPPVVWGNPVNPVSFLRMITTGAASGEVFYNPFADLQTLEHVARILTLYPSYEFTWPGIALALGGGVVFLRIDRRMFVATALIVVFTLVMVSSYGIHDIFNYFLPIYHVLAIWFGWAVLYLLELAGRTYGVDEELQLWGPRGRQLLVVVLIFLIPAVLLINNMKVLDRSGHRDPADFAQMMFTVVPENSYILADFWTWTPMLYAQVVENARPDVTVVPALSIPEAELEAILADVESSGVPAFLTTRLEDAPGNRLGPYSLRLQAPYSVQGLPTDSQPLPSYKDRLVPRGAVYRVGRGVPRLEVNQVPAPARIEPATFGGVITLQGFSISSERVRVGQTLELDFYWELENAIGDNLWLDLLFTDGQGGVETEAGIPIWLASHWVGGGAYPTSQWRSNQLYQESYLNLVPRQVEPGSYQVRALAYLDNQRQQLFDARQGSRTLTSIVLAEIQVLPAD